MSPRAFTELERSLAAYFGRAHCVLVGSGTTALYSAFRVLRSRAPVGDPAPILFPNVTCETAVNAAIFAGFEPRFCDVSRDDFLMTGASVEAALGTGEVAALVPTHIFGHLVDASELDGRFGSSMPIIEDAAQAYGGDLGGARAGSMGLASVVSFGAGKLLDCGGGGALLCDDDDFASACRETAAQVPDDEDRSAEHRREVMKEMMAARKSLRGERAALVRRQRAILHEHRDGYLSHCRAEWAEAIERAFEGIDEIVAARRELASELDSLLAGRPGIALPVRKGHPVLWRYSFLVEEDQRDAMAAELKGRGLSVSRLFPPCTAKFSESRESLPVSESIAKSILNLDMPYDRAGNAEIVKGVREVIG